MEKRRPPFLNIAIFLEFPSTQIGNPDRFHYRPLVTIYIQLQRILLLSSLCLIWTFPGFAAEPAAVLPPLVETSDNSTNAPPLRQLGPGLYAIGDVQFSTSNRTVRFPGSVNMNQGAIEYWLVSSAGKLHESVFRTDVEPFHIHLAMLFLGAHGSTNASPDKLDITKAVPGDSISLWVEWQTDGQTVRRRAEDQVWNLQTVRPMTTGPWNYSGSWTFNGRYVAQTERSIVAVMRDPDALVNFPRPGYENDKIWEAKPDRVPSPGTPVTIIIEFPKPPAGQPSTTL